MKLSAYLIWLWPGRVQELLDFQQIAVRVTQEELIDVEFFVLLGRGFKAEALCLEPFIPAIYVLTDQSNFQSIGFTLVIQVIGSIALFLRIRACLE